ncbi:MFS transporter [Bacillus sp. USDA818B3_A]|uniref:MFS transporter n=1 Tax=Bacillus sp. USDA818B3_A TaxID=2698834 RepID=UPI001F026FB5|nr:MFS transporter [Bacillus sp. USDA818B3_A]
MSLFKRISGNSRACMAVEPMFIIPYSLYVTYASLYMLELGVNEKQIGMITSLGLVVQIFSSFISGFLTDRMGRKNALLIFDLFSWSIATLIWAVSQNFWFFVIAAIINGFQKVPHIAWTCLIVEDTLPNQRSLVYTVLQFISVVGGLFAPLGGLMVSEMGLISGVRVMYLVACLSMTAMFIIRHLTTHETSVGMKKRRESSQMKLKSTLFDYVKTGRNLLYNYPLLLIFSIYVLFQFQLTIQNTYLSIYLVEELALEKSFLGVFPAISSVCMLILLVFVIPRFREEFNFFYMGIGFSFMMVSSVLVLTAKSGNITQIIFSTILSSTGLLLSTPYLEAAVANVMEDDSRANVSSILQVILLLFISPAGIIGGITYRVDPRIPFLLTLAAMLISIILLSFRTKLMARNENLKKKVSI